MRFYYYKLPSLNCFCHAHRFYCCFLVFWGFFWPCRTACGILVPQPGIEPVPPAVEAQSPDYWTTREFQIMDRCVLVFICLQVFFISSLISSVIHLLFTSILFNLHMFVFLLFFFPLESISRLIALWSENIWFDMIAMISVFLNLLRFVLWPTVWCVLENVPCALKKNMYSAALDGMFCISLLSSSNLMWHLRPVFPYRFSVWMICPLM